MKKVKTISRPVLESAKQLSPTELNKIRFSAKRTVLTPERLEKMRSSTISDDAPTE
ncbi:MAG: hypothetical protein NC127_08120 [Muribaculum sp.]|nr:hypothetical protein [Muribaculum sp.]